MIKLKYRPTSPADIVFLAANLRRIDLETMRAMQGPLPDVERRLRLALEMTPSAQTLLDPASGNPVAIFGVATMKTPEGTFHIPWILATEQILTLRREILAKGGLFLKEAARHYPCLTTLIDSRFKRSLCRLERLGFTIHPSEPYGTGGALFHRAEMVRRQ